MIWYLKQLLPLSYRSTYTDGEGNKHFATWNMWFGKCFNVNDVVVG